MRLTLRTLLGYLDDILEPQQARELGEKISESAVAAALVARIKEVVRRRRIGAPELTGSGSDPDPNVVAEYLDNTLSAEKIEDLERLCLESDMHLAEVAACHQVLTLVLGEPVDIQPGLRERMYALGKVSESAGDGQPRTTASGPAAPSVQPVTPASAPARQSVPDYLSSGPRWRSLVPAIAAVLVLGVWIGLIISDPASSWRIWESKGTPAGGSDAAAGNGQVIAATERPAGTAVTEPGPVVDGAAAVPAPAAGQPEGGAAPVTVGVNPPPPQDAPEPSAPAPAASVEPTPQLAGQPPAAAGPAAEPTPREPLAPAMPPDAAAAAAARAVNRVLYNSTEGVLLHRTANDVWMVLPRRALLHAGDEVAAPEPFESVLQLLDADAELALTGARIVWREPPAETDAALDVDRGRLQFRRSPLSAPERVVRLQLWVGGQTWRLDLLEAGTVCGLEVRWQPSAAGPETSQTLRYDGAFSLASGRARLTAEDGAMWMLETGAAQLQIISGRPATTLQPLLAPPDWMLPPTGGAAAVARQTARQFEESFRLDLPMSETIPARVDDRHPRVSEFAARALALTDSDGPLVRALSAPHEETRRTAIDALGIGLRSSPERSLRIQDAIDRVFPPEVSATVLRLLYGYTADDARNPEISNQLVDWLGDSNVAVRELAFTQIRRLTGGSVTYMYHPDRQEAQRAVSIRQWKNHLRREGALVGPAAAATDPNSTPQP